MVVRCGPFFNASGKMTSADRNAHAHVGTGVTRGYHSVFRELTGDIDGHGFGIIEGPEVGKGLFLENAVRFVIQNHPLGISVFNSERQNISISAFRGRPGTIPASSALKILG
jgi:hypothetical protein